MTNYVCTLVSSIILALVLFIFDTFYHGYLLAESYKYTSYLWRPELEMKEYLSFNIFIYALLAIFVVTLFKEFVLKLDKKHLLHNSIKFGLLVGGVIGVILLGFYAYMPISLNLALAWFGGSLIHGVIMTIVLYLLYRNRK